MRLIHAAAASALLLAVSACNDAGASDVDDAATAESIEVSEAQQIATQFLEAAGSGDMDTLSNLMADDFVWHNEGDKTLPWIGNWEGKETVLGTFLPAFGAGLTTTSWSTDYTFVNGNDVVFMGTMSATANPSENETGVFSWAVRVHVEDGKVKSWNWFEDSFAVSKAYHGS